MALTLFQSGTLPGAAGIFEADQVDWENLA